VFAHESDRSQKPLFKTGKTRHSTFIETGGSPERCRDVVRCSSSGQVMSIWWRGVNHDNFEG
jgi:hypothetical protein